MERSVRRSPDHRLWFENVKMLNKVLKASDASGYITKSAFVSSLVTSVHTASAFFTIFIAEQLHTSLWFPRLSLCYLHYHSRLCCSAWYSILHILVAALQFAGMLLKEQQILTQLNLDLCTFGQTCYVNECIFVSYCSFWATFTTSFRCGHRQASSNAVNKIVAPGFITNVSSLIEFGALRTLFASFSNSMLDTVP